MACRIFRHLAYVQLLRPIAGSARPSFLPFFLMPSQNGKRTYSQTMSNGDPKPDGVPEKLAKTEEWKYRVPYRAHTNEDFKTLYEAACHCGKVKYQLSREAPLDSKLCHCTTCQTQHGMCRSLRHCALCTRTDLPPKLLRSNGQPSSIKKTSTSPTATTTSSGTTRPARLSSTNCRARCAVATVTAPSWMRGGI